MSLRPLIMTAALLSGFGVAQAADLPPRTPASYPAPAVVVPAVYNWTGVYIGANGGYGTGNYNLTSGGTTASGFDMAGPLAGGPIGAHSQVGQFVIGVEVDGQWANINNTSLFPGLGTLEVGVTWFLTARGRLGFAFNNVLVYGTGGYTYGNFEATATSGGLSATASEGRGGWNVGGGAEVAFGNWSIKAEYLYLRSFEESLALIGFPTVNDYIDAHIGRVGLNYRFGGGPVIARY
jgi:outer membrane immunogenic protein